MSLSEISLAGITVIAIVVVALSIKRPHVGLAAILLAFIPAPLYPTERFGWAFYAFVGFTLVVLAGWVFELSWHIEPFRRQPTECVGFSLKLWLLLCTLGLPLSLLLNRGHFDDRIYFFAKGALPFIYLLVFFVVRSFPFSTQQVQIVLNYIVVLAIAFALITFAIYAIAQVRPTWIYTPLIFPFAALGCNISFARMMMEGRRFRALGWGILTLVFVFAVLLTFTKAQLIALFASLALITVLLVSSAGIYPIRRAVEFTAVLALIVVASVAFSRGEIRNNFSSLLLSRFTDTGTTETRLSEWKEALSQFAQSPVVGKGIGYQLERVEFGEVISSNYVHNQIVYISMTTGIAGLATYGFLLFSWGRLLHRFRQVRANAASPVVALHGCVCMLIVYALMFASFRTIQHNFLLGLFLGLILNFYPNQSSRSASGGAHQCVA